MKACGLLTEGQYCKCVTKTVQIGGSCTHKIIVNMCKSLVIIKLIYSFAERVLSIKTEFK